MESVELEAIAPLLNYHHHDDESLSGVTLMQVERWFEEVKDRRVLIELPDHFNNRRVEIIVLTVDEPSPVHRRPHPDIAGQIKIHGDILNSVPETDWNLPR